MTSGDQGKARPQPKDPSFSKMNDGSYVVWEPIRGSPTDFARFWARLPFLQSLVSLTSQIQPPATVAALNCGFQY